MNRPSVRREKIAIATRDCQLSHHFRDTQAFAVFLVGDKAEPAPVYRVNLGPDYDSGSSHERYHRQIADLLADCSHVICGGIGQHAAEILEARGIHPLVTADEGAPEAIYQRFRKDSLSLAKTHPCCHGAPRPDRRAPSHSPLDA